MGRPRRPASPPPSVGLRRPPRIQSRSPTSRCPWIAPSPQPGIQSSAPHRPLGPWRTTSPQRRPWTQRHFLRCRTPPATPQRDRRPQRPPLGGPGVGPGAGGSSPAGAGPGLAPAGPGLAPVGEQALGAAAPRVGLPKDAGAPPLQRVVPLPQGAGTWRILDGQAGGHLIWGRVAMVQDREEVVELGRRVLPEEDDGHGDLD